MPYRDVPPLRRPWWEKLTGAWLAGTVVVGAAGALYPSSSLVSALGAGALLYSVGMIAFGCLGLRSWWAGHRRAESVALICIAALTFLHGIVILVVTGDGGAQTALRLIQAAAGVLAWVGIRQSYGASRSALREAVHAVSREEGR